MADDVASVAGSANMRKDFSIWSLLGVGFALTNSWFCISSGLATGINSGGPLVIIYGICIITFITCCSGISLSELASAMPSAGGQYAWAHELAPRRAGRLPSYLTGWFSWTGALFSSASVALALGSALVGCYQLGHPEFVVQAWHVVVTYQLLNAFCFMFNCYGPMLPIIAKLALYWSLFSFFVIFIAVPALTSSHQQPKFVFATFINNTGWRSNGIAFIVGLINSDWSFGGIDGATHMSEEISEPEKRVPTAILGTVAIGFITSLGFAISMFLSISGDFTSIATTSTGVPILQLFYNASHSVTVAIVLECLIFVTGVGCLVANHTWQSRLCWSFARDGGLPGHKSLSRIHPRLDVPFNAHMASCIIVALLGCLYLGADTAFNSMIAACISLSYASYSIPVICLLMQGRKKILTGPFYLGTVGLIANIVLLTWTTFTFVMYSFPYTMPATVGSMNYVSLVYAVIGLAILADWLLRGRHRFRARDVADKGPEYELVDHARAV